jgi:hypothetical protein
LLCPEDRQSGGRSRRCQTCRPMPCSISRPWRRTYRSRASFRRLSGATELGPAFDDGSTRTVRPLSHLETPLHATAPSAALLRNLGHCAGRLAGTGLTELFRILPQLQNAPIVCESQMSRHEMLGGACWRPSRHQSVRVLKCVAAQYDQRRPVRLCSIERCPGLVVPLNARGADRFLRWATPRLSRQQILLLLRGAFVQMGRENHGRKALEMKR